MNLDNRKTHIEHIEDNFFGRLGGILRELNYINMWWDVSESLVFTSIIIMMRKVNGNKE